MGILAQGIRRRQKKDTRMVSRLKENATRRWRFFPFLVARDGPRPAYSTVTDFARLRGLSTSVPRASAVWYASNCSATTCRIGDKSP